MDRTASPTSQEDLDAIARVHQAWVSGIGARDADALRDLVTEDYEVWAHAADAIRGPDATVRVMRSALDRYRSVEQSFRPIETVVAGEWAFERGVERLTVTPVDGGPARTMEQRALLILHRGADGRWRFARGMTNGLPATQHSDDA